MLCATLPSERSSSTRGTSSGKRDETPLFDSGVEGEGSSRGATTVEGGSMEEIRGSGVGSEVIEEERELGAGEGAGGGGKDARGGEDEEETLNFDD